MPPLMYKTRFFIAILFSVILLLAGCGKTGDPNTQNILEAYFETNILNKDFKVLYAKDNGTEITSQYDGWIFRLFKNTLYDGPMTGIKNGVTYSGTWSSNSDYGQLIINITQPTTPVEFNFINRTWRFAEKAVPVMKLAPWGSSAPTELHMQRL